MARGLGARKGRLETMMSAEGRPGPRLSWAAARTLREWYSISRPFHLPDRATRPVSPAAAKSPTLIFDLNPEYVREVLLPELVQRHLESNGTLDYQVEVLTREHPPVVIYQSDPGTQVAANADASVGLFDIALRSDLPPRGPDPAAADAGVDAADPVENRDAGRCSCAIAPDLSKPSWRRLAGATWRSPQAYCC